MPKKKFILFIFSVFGPFGNTFIHNQNIPSDWNIPYIQGFNFILKFLISSKQPIFIFDLDEKFVIHPQTLEIRNFHIWHWIGAIFTLLDLFCKDLQA